MRPSFGDQGFRTTSMLSVWILLGDTWGMWWNGRHIAGLYPEMRLRAAVARLLVATPGEPVVPLPGLPPSFDRPAGSGRLGSR
ncbi:hypothetical protein ABH900_003007 [Stenotrophomonas sp. AN71]